VAELVVKSQCNSSLRQITDTALNITFPIWGVIAPVCTIGLAITSIGFLQAAVPDKAAEFFAYCAVCFCVSFGSLLLKRALMKDLMIVDKEGIRLPKLLGTHVNLSSYVPWQNVQRIEATINSTDENRSHITLRRLKGGPVRLSTADLGKDFVEQFLLASNMWVPQLCDESIAEFQNVLRIGAKGEDQTYTELWEEELGRRFCPTSYIPLEVGRVLRNSTLKVMSHLASGGLSAIYLCQLDGKKLVVLKEATIPDSGAESIKEKAREMFEREATLLMKLNNPGVVQVLDCFTEGGRNYLLLDYVNGVDLRQLIKQNGPQSEANVLDWAIQIANAVKYLHEREHPIIHRDLTPDNIVLRNDGQVIIVDFGAANEFIGNATGTFVGKHSFIAPEQFRGKATTHSDIYAFGCTLFFLLTGVEPEALSPSNPKEHISTVSDELSELVQSCTQSEVADRYQSVAQLLPVLRRLASQTMVV
jgi:tRNA A-37 threonylcarbamoyl transferase component Bud32